MNLGVMLAMIIIPIAVAIGLNVFGVIIPNLNQAAIGTGAYSLITQAPIVVAGIMLLAIVVAGFTSLAVMRLGG